MSECDRYEKMIHDLAIELKSLSESYYQKMNISDCEQ
jgi:hypothetical protein